MSFPEQHHIMNVVKQYVHSFGVIGMADDNPVIIINYAVLGKPFLGDEGDEVKQIQLNLETRDVRVTDYDGEVTEYEALQPVL